MVSWGPRECSTVTGFAYSPIKELLEWVLAKYSPFLCILPCSWLLIGKVMQDGQTKFAKTQLAAIWSNYILLDCRLNIAEVQTSSIQGCGL